MEPTRTPYARHITSSAVRSRRARPAVVGHFGSRRAGSGRAEGGEHHEQTRHRLDRSLGFSTGAVVRSTFRGGRGAGERRSNPVLVGRRVSIHTGRTRLRRASVLHVAALTP